MENNATKRVIAKLIDIIIFYLLHHLIPVVGIFLASTYILLGDTRAGFSAGKKIMKLKVIESSSSEYVSLRASFIRNLPIFIFLITPYLSLLSMIIALFSVPFMILETYLMFSDPEHQRVGDLLASTKVVSE